MKGALVAGAVLAIAGAAQADDWVTTGNLARDNAAIDQTSIVKNGHDVTYWVLLAGRTGFDQGKPVDYMLLKERIDCTADTRTVYAMTEYARDGSLIGSMSVHENEAQPITPESVGAEMRDVVCDRPHPATIYIGSLDNAVATLRDLHAPQQPARRMTRRGKS